MVRQIEPVLVTWGESRMALAATRALGAAGIPVAVLAEKRWAPAWQSRFCTERIEAPDADRGEAYLEFLEALVRGRKYSGLFFCDDRTAFEVASQRARFLPHVPFLLPDSSLVKLTRDKAAMMNHAQSHGIPIPVTVFPSGTEDVESCVMEMRFPLVVKGAGGFASRSLQIARTSSELRSVFNVMIERQRRDGYKFPPHIQEYVEGDVFSVLALCMNGDPFAMFMMRKIRTYPTWGGVCVEAESVADHCLADAARRFLESLSWHGVIEIEFLRDKRDGRYLLIEPSPDPNWGLDLAIAAGFNVPYMAWQVMQGMKPEPEQVVYRKGVRFVWFLPEGLRYLLERPQEFLPMLMCALNPRVGCDFRQRDWGPLMNQLRTTWWAVRDRS